MAMGSGLQQPPRGVGEIKARAAASSQHRDGRTAWWKSLVRLDSEEGCGTGQDLPFTASGFIQPWTNSCRLP